MTDPDVDAVPRQFNRELSWLDFNERVLTLADDESVPTLERAKFLAIFNQNLDEFRQRAVARLQLLPPHDPQFRRNRERVARDAEREHLILEWDLGYDEES